MREFSAGWLLYLLARNAVITLLFFGVILCAYHFTMVMIAVRLDESE